MTSLIVVGWERGVIRNTAGQDGSTDCHNPVCALGFAMTEGGGTGLVLSLPCGSRFPLCPLLCGQCTINCHCEEANGRRGNPFPPQTPSSFMPAGNSCANHNSRDGARKFIPSPGAGPKRASGRRARRTRRSRRRRRPDGRQGRCRTVSTRRKGPDAV